MITFSYKHWYDHLIDVVRPPWAFMGSSFAVFATLWTIIEATSFFGQNETQSLQNGGFYIYLVIFSAACGFSITFLKIRRSTPIFAESLPKAAQRVVRDQRPGWEFHLAQIILVERIDPLDRRLEGILNGTLLVLLRPELNPVDYMAVIGLRSTNMIRMAEVSKHIFERSFPSCFHEKFPVEERVSRILKAVEEVEEFYETTIAMEEELRAMSVPEGFEKLHEMQANWTEAIRVPFRSLLRFLQAMRNAANSKGKISTVKFSFEMEAPENIDAFMEETARLSAKYCRRF